MRCMLYDKVGDQNEVWMGEWMGFDWGLDKGDGLEEGFVWRNRWY